jgi:hypothetical protein
MPSPELTDFDRRFEDLVAQLRAAAPVAPESLRLRVRETAEARLERRNWPAVRVSRRVLIPVAIALLAAAGTFGAVLLAGGSSGGQSSAGQGVKRAARELDSNPAALPAAPVQPQKTLTVAGGRTSTTNLGGYDALTNAGIARSGADHGSALPPSRSRLQRYAVDLYLRVKDEQALTTATDHAMRWTRGYGGYVAAVQTSSSERGGGDASLRLRIPIAHIQEAILRFSSLGKVVARQISIQDLQAGLNNENRRIVQLRQSIAKLETELRNASSVDRPALEARLAAVRSQLSFLLRQRQGTLREGRLTTIALELTTRTSNAIVVRHHPGRIDRAARHAWSLTVKWLAGALYALIVLSPLIVLVAAGLVGRRYLRRREEARLLARA